MRKQNKLFQKCLKNVDKNIRDQVRKNIDNNCYNINDRVIIQSKIFKDNPYGIIKDTYYDVAFTNFKYKVCNPDTLQIIGWFYGYQLKHNEN